MSEELQPCPFCGSAEDRLRMTRFWTFRDSNTGGWCHVKCTVCKAEGPIDATAEAARVAWDERAAV